MKFLSFQNNPKNLDLSKTDLDLWDCLGRIKLIAKFHRTDLVICCHSREGKNLFYSRINMIKEIMALTQNSRMSHVNLSLATLRSFVGTLPAAKFIAPITLFT